MSTTLTTTPRTRESMGITPTRARVYLIGLPKAGKTTIASQWNPAKTLILDTHNGTALLDGEHFVEDVTTWEKLSATVDAIVAGGHPYETIIVDLIDDVYKMADLFAADKKGFVAAGLIEYGKGMAETEGLFRQAMGKLLGSPYGVWFIGHAEDQEVNKVMKLVPKLDKRVKTYIQGACDFNLVAEALGDRRVLRTAPNLRYEVGCRVPLQDGMNLDARALYASMAEGLNGKPPVAAAAPAAQPEAVTA